MHRNKTIFSFLVCIFLLISFVTAFNFENSNTLPNLDDVLIISPLDTEVLIYNSSSGLWYNGFLNESGHSVNNSLYWDGNLWSDTRWLNIDGSNANQNIDISPYSITASNFIGTFTGNSSIWSRSGTNTFLTNTLDYVGIGTTTPSHELNVIGDLNVTGIIYGADFDGVSSLWNESGSDIYTYNLSKNVGIGTDSPEGLFHVYETAPGAYGSSNPLVIEEGRVGIGTTTPNRLFTVKKDGGVIGLGSNDYENIVFGAAGSSGAAADEAYFQMNNAGVAKIVLRTDANSYFNGGNVGIGTTTPQNELNVIGDINATGYIYGDGSQLSNLNVSSINLSDYVPYTGASQNLVLGNNNFSVGGTDLFVDVDSGFVGIGTTTPNGRLNIITSTSDYSASGFNMKDSSGTNLFNVRNDQKFTLGGGGQHTQLTIAGTGQYSGISSPAYSSMIDNLIKYKDWSGNIWMILDMTRTNNPRVGIGTTSPQNTLNVIGDGNFTGNVYGTFVGDGSQLTGISGGIWTNDSGVASYNNNIKYGIMTNIDNYIISNGTGSFAGGWADYMGFGAKYGIISSGTGSVALGYALVGDLIASGNGAIALGKQAQATGSGSVAIGEDAKATASDSIAIGDTFTNAVANTIRLGTNAVYGLIVHATGVDILGDLNVIGDLNVTNATGTTGLYQDSNGKVGINTLIENMLDTFTVTDGMNLIHTALISDDHAFEIDFNADGFGDAKAIFINYITGLLVDEKNEEVIFINIDESQSTGGHVTALEVVTTQGSAKVTGLEVGVNVHPIEQISGNFSNMSTALNNTIDVLAPFTSETNNITIFNADNDYVTIGSPNKFEELEFLLDTVASGAGIKPVFYHSTGIGTWNTFSPGDGTNGMRNTGVILWEDSDLTNWNTGTGSEYLIKIERTANSLTTPPIETLVQLAEAEEYHWDKDGSLKIKNMTLGSSTDSQGITMYSPDGTKYTCSVANGGAFSCV